MLTPDSIQAFIICAGLLKKKKASLISVELLNSDTLVCRIFRQTKLVWMILREFKSLTRNL